MSARRTAVVAFLLLAVALPAAGAQWYEHYERGLALELEGSWEEALESFRAAGTLNPRPARRVNTYGRNFLFDYDPFFHSARCLVELDRPVEAGIALLRSRRAGVTSTARLDELRTRIEHAVRAQEQAAPAPTAVPAGLLVVSSDPAGALVEVDGLAVGTTPMAPLPVAPGPRSLRVSATGYRPLERQVTVMPGSTFTLDAPLAPVVAAVPTRAVVAAATPRPAPTEVPTPSGRATAAPVQAVVRPTAVPTMAPAPQPTVAEQHATVAATQAPRPAPTADGFRPVEVPAQPARRQIVLLLVVAAVGAVVLVVVLLRSRPRSVASTQAAVAAPTASTRIEGGTTFVDRAAPSTRYEVLGTLGRGGMATTYRARRTRDSTVVALKVPHESCLAEETFVTRFLREGRLGEQLHHPNIVRILEAGEEAGRPYLAMELIEGRTLKQELRQGALPLRRALAIARDVAEALDYAHAKGVVHRDLKPDNIMILPDGAVKVMDFGIARKTGQEGLTSTNLFIGTPLYAAPEMVDPKSIDHRVDLYALGIMLFEMLEGVVPFSADSPYRVLEMHLRQPLPAHAELRHPVPPAVWALIEKLCAKDRQARFPSAEALLVELQRVMRDLPQVETQGV